MARKKRGFTTFNLSFLDIMSCGFGAVVLVFLIIDHSIKAETQDLNKDLLSEVNLLEEDVTDGEAGLVRLRNTLSDVDLQLVEAQGRATRITEELSQYEALIQDIARDGYTDDADIEELKAEIQSLEDEVKKLREASEAESGRSAREFVGEGNRQYLTGLNLGGRHIAILLDVSSSMLADRLVNIIRLRNMSEALQRSADKWVRAVNTVDWLTAQLPVSSNYQVITFNTEARAALSGTDGQWLEVADQDQLEKVTASLRDTTPTGGTSLENAFIALQQLSPSPDNIFLITDGLPTQGTTAPRGNTISGRDRQRLYRQAIRQLPSNVPINVILAPMEGDPMAASEFWQLAQVSRGSFMSPSQDWP
ncbi:MAG: VWA domain-containing protein [Halieaceae bacterium]|nr:VWA domain-containing protein [Halieaceae bacterium]